MAEHRRPDEGEPLSRFYRSLRLTRLCLYLESPLLRHTDDDEQPVVEDDPTFLQRVTQLAQEPLSPLSKLLLGACLVLLLLASVFIGLFAGAQHRLNTGDGDGNRHHYPSDPHTSVVTHTSTETVTDISTTTATAPAPGPTGDPLDVSRDEYARFLISSLNRNHASLPTVSSCPRLSSLLWTRPRIPVKIFMTMLVRCSLPSWPPAN